MGTDDKERLLNSLTDEQRRTIAQIIRETDPVQEIGDDGHYAYSIDDTLDSAASLFAAAVPEIRDDACEDKAVDNLQTLLKALVDFKDRLYARSNGIIFGSLVHLRADAVVEHIDKLCVAIRKEISCGCSQ